MLVKTRLKINIAVTVMMAFFIAVVLLLTMGRVNRAVDESHIASEIIARAFERNTIRNDYLRTHSERAKKQWFAKDEQLVKVLKSASDKFQDTEDKKIIEELIKDSAATRKIFITIIKIREKPKAGPDSAALSQEAENRLISQLRMRAYDRAMYAHTLDEEAGRRLRSAMTLAGGVIIAILLLSVTALIGNSWKLSRIIADRIERLRYGAHIIGNGNLDHRIETEGEDELTELSQAFNTMTAKVRASYLELEKEITERKGAEEGLRLSEGRFRTMTDAIPQLAWVAHADGSIYWYNQRWHEYTGITPQQIEGTGWQRIHDPQLLPTVLEQWKNSVATGEPFEMIFPLRGADGQFRQFLTRVQPFRDAQGKIIQWFGTNTDITELNRAKDALQEMNEELEIRVAQRTDELKLQHVELQEAYHKLESQTAERIRTLEELRQKEQLLIQQSRMAAMGEMLVNISHQWRQPLNHLGLKVQELGLSYKHGLFSGSLLDGSIDKMMELIQHMSQTINDFQEFLSPNKEKIAFRVDSTIEKTVGLVEENFKSNGISIESQLTEGLLINGYPNEFGQVILNLLSNAKDALVERGSVDARISINSWAEKDRVVVTIADNAGGIKQEIIDKIFDAYFTTKELGKGTGVGLFLSKTIIEKNMGGRLSVRNVEGGAEFRIEV